MVESVNVDWPCAQVFFARLIVPPGSRGKTCPDEGAVASRIPGFPYPEQGAAAGCVAPTRTLADRAAWCRTLKRINRAGCIHAQQQPPGLPHCNQRLRAKVPTVKGAPAKKRPACAGLCHLEP
jgi:hypothetical protein